MVKHSKRRKQVDVYIPKKPTPDSCAASLDFANRQIQRANDMSAIAVGFRAAADIGSTSGDLEEGLASRTITPA